MSAIRAWLLLVGLMLPIAQARERPLGERIPSRSGLRPAVIGMASWYGWKHDGRLMANGQRFRALGLTAASRFLPLGTHVRVTNLHNGRSVELLITDRGPYIPGRILDVSLGAAKQLRMVESGLAPVRIELLSQSKGPTRVFAVSAPRHHR